MMEMLFIVKAGYGSLKEIKELDTPDYLDIIEFERMQSDIQDHIIKEARNGSS
jgi:hypothetical protein